MDYRGGEGCLFKGGLLVGDYSNMGACTPGGTHSPTVLPCAWFGSVLLSRLVLTLISCFSLTCFPFTFATDELKIPVLRQIVNVVSSLK